MNYYEKKYSNLIERLKPEKWNLLQISIRDVGLDPALAVSLEAQGFKLLSDVTCMPYVTVEALLGPFGVGNICDYLQSIITAKSMAQRFDSAAKAIAVLPASVQSRSVRELRCSKRLLVGLLKAKVLTVGSMSNLTYDVVRAWWGCGPKTRTELYKLMKGICEGASVWQTPKQPAPKPPVSPGTFVIQCPYGCVVLRNEMESVPFPSHLLPPRAIRVLQEQGVRTCGELARYGLPRLQKIEGVGARTIKDILIALRSLEKRSRNDIPDLDTRLCASFLKRIKAEIATASSRALIASENDLALFASIGEKVRGSLAMAQTKMEWFDKRRSTVFNKRFFCIPKTSTEAIVEETGEPIKKVRQIYKSGILVYADTFLSESLVLHPNPWVGSFFNCLDLVPTGRLLAFFHYAQSDCYLCYRILVRALDLETRQKINDLTREARRLLPVADIAAEFDEDN